MPTRPTAPVARAFLLCREIFEDVHTRAYLLVAPGDLVVEPAFPCTVGVSFYAQLSEVHGRYRLTLQLRDDEDQVVWGEALEPPFEGTDPLKTYQIAFLQRPIHIPRAGRYSAVLLANGDEVARTPVRAEL